MSVFNLAQKRLFPPLCPVSSRTAFAEAAKSIFTHLLGVDWHIEHVGNDLEDCPVDRTTTCYQYFG
jgi:hypothetical protein